MDEIPGISVQFYWAPVAEKASHVMARLNGAKGSGPHYYPSDVKLCPVINWTGIRGKDSRVIVRNNSNGIVTDINCSVLSNGTVIHPLPSASSSVSSQSM